VPYRSDAGLLVLHSLRLKGFAEVETIAALSGFTEVEVGQRLDDFADEDLVIRRDGRITGWALSPAGHERHRALLAAELDAMGSRAVVDDAYQRFLGLNGEFLSLCTDWQVRDVEDARVVNDHTDRAYDTAIIERLERVHEGVLPIWIDLAGALARFGHYGDRLSVALQRVREGEAEWLTRPLIDSYHTVWFELHEDLLTTLGIERSKEDDR
jgi:hypothetical protein